ncbi:hypothetical protein H2248_007929 [Termitomyces sp. 'cryptogamus']|nr:hypothetical protein H2248_007929 [Termitomyces sp. 'cryptogamus']
MGNNLNTIRYYSISELVEQLSGIVLDVKINRVRYEEVVESTGWSVEYIVHERECWFDTGMAYLDNNLCNDIPFDNHSYLKDFFWYASLFDTYAEVSLTRYKSRFLHALDSLRAPQLISSRNHRATVSSRPTPRSGTRALINGIRIQIINTPMEEALQVEEIASFAIANSNLGHDYPYEPYPRSSKPPVDDDTCIILHISGSTVPQTTERG